MIQLLVAIYDEKALLYSSPFAYVSAGVAVRQFRDAMDDRESAYAKHPSDFSLYHIGNYNDQSGAIEVVVPPELIVRASSLINGPTLVREVKDASA